MSSKQGTPLIAFPTHALLQILGGDVAGIVEEADEGSAFKKGDAVAALTMGFLGGEHTEGEGAT